MEQVISHLIRFIVESESQRGDRKSVGGVSDFGGGTSDRSLLRPRRGQGFQGQGGLSCCWGGRPGLRLGEGPDEGT